MERALPSRRAAPGVSAASQPNVLVVCVDCLRADHVQESYADTPFLDALGNRGLAATDMYAAATTTSPCVAGLLTGTHAERHGVLSLDVGPLDEGVVTFAERFAAAGYHTEALVTGPLVAATGLDRGFDRYRYREPDESLFSDWRETARERLAALPEPFAAYLHLWEVHEDVHVPSAHDDPAYGATRYARALAALDRELEALLAVLPEDTLLVVTGDHGESITNRDSPLRLAVKATRDAVRYYGGVDTRPAVRRLNRRLADRGAGVPDHYLENGHGENAFDYAAHVPFLLAGPGVDPATVDATTRQIDVLPTLFAAADVAFDPETLDGAAFVPPDDVDDRPAYVRACGESLKRRANWARAVRHDGRKYVEYPDRDWPASLYDLTADPAELDPVVDPAPDRVAHLRRAFPEADLGAGERLDVDERLRLLGYR
jgi:arylsulfatase A-like enzyme